MADSRALTEDTIDVIRRFLAALPDEAARIEVLSALLDKRCRKCLDLNPSGQFWCCYDSRGG